MPSLFAFLKPSSKSRRTAFDPQQYRPVMRVSICTGERTAGFQDRQGGAFVEVMQVRNDRELAAFCTEYGVTPHEIVTIY